MKTLYVVIMLLAAGSLAQFPAALALNLAGLPGALAAGTPGQRSKQRFVVGSLLSALGQSYVYLAYVALVVAWTRVSAARADIVGWVIWPFAGYAVFVPISWLLYKAREEAAEHTYANPQVEALQITFLVASIGFFAFAIFPALYKLLWGWVPFV